MRRRLPTTGATWKTKNHVHGQRSSAYGVHCPRSYASQTGCQNCLPFLTGIPVGCCWPASWACHRPVMKSLGSTPATSAARRTPNAAMACCARKACAAVTAATTPWTRAAVTPPPARRRRSGRHHPHPGRCCRRLCLRPAAALHPEDPPRQARLHPARAQVPRVQAVRSWRMRARRMPPGWTRPFCPARCRMAGPRWWERAARHGRCAARGRAVKDVRCWAHMWHRALPDRMDRAGGVTPR